MCAIYCNSSWVLFASAGYTDDYLLGSCYRGSCSHATLPNPSLLRSVGAALIKATPSWNYEWEKSAQPFDFFISHCIFPFAGCKQLAIQANRVGRMHRPAHYGDSFLHLYFLVMTFPYICSSWKCHNALRTFLLPQANLACYLRRSFNSVVARENNF